MRPPLDGFRVLDFSRLFAGPLCSMVLADLGADVVKIESPAGDDARHFGPPFLGGEGMNFIALNRGKRSVVLDLKSDAGRRAAAALARTADIVIENFRPGVAERLGIGHEQLAAERPELVYCSISGFGAYDADGKRPALDLILQAITGVMHRQGAGGEPKLLCITVADTYAAAQAVQGILAALLVRARDGRGQRVEVSLLDGLLTAQAYRVICDPETMALPAWDDTVPYQAFETGDDGSWLAVAVVSAANWRALCLALEEPELADDPRFTTNPLRVENREALLPNLVERFRRRTRAEWLELLTAAGVPTAPVQTLQELLEDPEMLASGSLAELDHPSAGRLRTLGTPIRLAATPARVSSSPPRLGEHTRDVLQAAGVAWSDIDACMALLEGATV